MANEMNKAGSAQQGEKTGVQSAAASAARSKSRAITANMSAGNKYVFGVLSKCISACRLLQSRLKDGKLPTPEVMQSAANLAGEAGKAFVD